MLALTDQAMNDRRDVRNKLVAVARSAVFYEVALDGNWKNGKVGRPTLNENGSMSDNFIEPVRLKFQSGPKKAPENGPKKRPQNFRRNSLLCNDFNGG